MEEWMYGRSSLLLFSHAPTKTESNVSHMHDAGENPFLRIAREVEALPADERPAALAEAIGRAIPFVGTAGVDVEALTSTRVMARLPDRPSVHNHVGGLHASAMALLAETVTGLVVAINVAGDCVPVIQTLSIDYRKRAEGSLRAEATLADEEARRIQTSKVGKIDVPVRVMDEEGQEPLDCTLRWAWLPRRRAGLET